MINADDEVSLAYLIDPTFELVNTEGRPLTGGYIEVYIHGTRTKYYCYSDWNGSLHPFKIPLDSLGANIILASPAHSYDIYVYNKYGSMVMSRYNVVPSTGDGTVIKDVVTITSNDNTVSVESSDQTNWDLSIKDTVDRVEQNEQDISNIKGDIEDIETALSNKKDKQEQKTFSGSQTKTITKVEQDEQGVITVTYDNIDLPPEVPNVEITSPNGTIDVQSSTDVQTNTKTFTIDVKKGDVDYYVGSRPTVAVGRTNYNIANNLIRADGNLDITHPGKGLYLVCVNANVRPEGIANEQHEIWLSIGPNNTYTMMHSLDWTNPQDTDISCASILKINGDEPITMYLSYGSTPSIGVNLSVGNVSVYRIDAIMGGSGETYTAGDGIDITNNVISADIAVQNAEKIVVDVDFGSTIQTVNSITTDGSTVRTDGFNFTLPTIKAGDGISFSKTGTETTISMDSEVTDVVETVEKLKQDLDTQITPNFDMPNISQVYDFADPSNWITANGACMLYQAFTIPINHEVRTVTDDADTPTLFGIYAQQSFGHKIMLALYEYQYAEAGEEHGSSTYVGDTGPVSVLQGVNEYPLKNRNPSITELRSDRVYYAALYLPSTAFVNGLYLAGCPSYGNQSVPAEPRLSCATENITWENQELDMTDLTTTLNHYQVIEIPGKDPYYQYYIGPWVGGYNERWSSPRFYMQIRNGEFNEPVIPTEPFTDLGETKLPRGGILASNLPNFSSTSSNSGFRDVTPLTNVTITAFEWIDNSATAHGWEAGNCVYSSDYSTNLSGVSNSVVDLGEVFHDESYTAYRHRITFTTPITLTANVTYRFLCSTWASSSEWIWSWADPTNVFDASNNGWYVDWSSNVSRYSHMAGQYLKLYDNNNNNHWVI